MKKVAAQQLTKNEDRNNALKLLALQLASITVLVAIHLM